MIFRYYTPAGPRAGGGGGGGVGGGGQGAYRRCRKAVLWHVGSVVCEACGLESLAIQPAQGGNVQEKMVEGLLRSPSSLAILHPRLPLRVFTTAQIPPAATQCLQCELHWQALI